MNRDEEHRLIGEADRGIKARHILEDELVKEAFQKIEEGILEKWKEAPIRDVEGQQALKLMHKVFTEFRGFFEDVLKTGDFAASVLERERSLAQRAKDAVRSFRQ